jgi:hypothetical protein
LINVSNLALQARYRGREYVITQLKDEHSSQGANEDILRREMELLCQGDWFKAQYDQEVRELGVNIPSEF